MPEQKLTWEQTPAAISAWVEYRFGYGTPEWKKDLADGLVATLKPLLRDSFEQGRIFGNEEEKSKGFGYKMKTADFETWYQNTYNK